MIDIDKKYQTRDGRKVRLISNNGTETYPIIGVIDNGGAPCSWTAEGYALKGSSLMANSDLVPVPEVVKMFAAACNYGPHTEGYTAALSRTAVEVDSRRKGPVVEVDLPVDPQPEPQKPETTPHLQFFSGDVRPVRNKRVLMFATSRSRHMRPFTSWAVRQHDGSEWLNPDGERYPPHVHIDVHKWAYFNEGN
ncbi:MAG: hypothetical protein ABFC80_09315 [Coriobacteriales bacterium]|nr:hypothetical protein [Nocardiaceae bacterium]